MKRYLSLAAGTLVLLVFAASCVVEGDSKADPRVALTFSKDVAPIFYQKCAYCHRPGEIAPMSLLTYKDARPWAKSIREKVGAGTDLGRDDDRVCGIHAGQSELEDHAEAVAFRSASARPHVFRIV